MKIGYIDYLNCVPFFHYLRKMGFNGDIVRGVPSALNRMLHEGAIDACPSSSFEYGRHWKDYYLLPHLSISAIGPVGSVLLLSQKPLNQLSGVPIALTGESATSVNLLRILLPEFFGTTAVKGYVPTETMEDLLSQGQPALLIGDRALRAAQNVDPNQIYDLGDVWYQKTSLPFVFALWMVRAAVYQENSEGVCALRTQLESALSLAWENDADLAQTSAETSFMTAPDIVKYWRMMSFVLEEEHLLGLQLYFKFCVKYGLLDEMPKLRFID